MNDKKCYGATYVTESGEDFGMITSIFVVAHDWDGYRSIGYCKPTDAEILEFCHPTTM
jgi:hypothetical protein